MPWEAQKSALISRRFAVMAAMILTALEFAGRRIDLDALAITPMTLTHMHRVLHRLQRADCARRKSRLQVHNVRQVLMMESRRIHRLLNIQPAISHA